VSYNNNNMRHHRDTSLKGQCLRHNSWHQ